MSTFEEKDYLSDAISSAHMIRLSGHPCSLSSISARKATVGWDWGEGWGSNPALKGRYALQRGHRTGAGRTAMRLAAPHRGRPHRNAAGRTTTRGPHYNRHRTALGPADHCHRRVPRQRVSSPSGQVIPFPFPFPFLFFSSSW